MKSVVVTGITTGIGHSTVSVLIKQGWRVFGSVRKEADAQAAKREFGELFIPLIFDVTDHEAVVAAAGEVRKHLNGETLLGLVNNAGSSYTDPLMVQSIEDFRMQLEVNVVGMFAVTQAFVPLLGTDTSLKGPKGRIVNLSSVGGRIGFPLLGAYVTSKHAVEGFSDALRRELILAGIDVIKVAPGSVQTAIWDKADTLSYSRVNGTIWEKPFKKFVSYMIKGGRTGLTSEQLGEVIANALTVRKPKTRYAPVKDKLMNETLPLMLPDRTVDKMIAKQFDLLPTSNK